jgi:SPP1 family predicted phage head-tail adaptor
VTFQEKTVIRNDFNEEVITWTDVCTVWGSVEDLSGREFLESRREGAEVTTRIRIRHRSDIVEEMRAVHGSRTFDVEAVLEPTGRSRELVVMARELV